MASETAETAATTLERLVNQFGGSEDIADVLNHLLGMHRTLQQKFTSQFIIPFVYEMARRYSDGMYDPRNEAACRLCSIMYTALKAEYGTDGEDNPIALPVI